MDVLPVPDARRARWWRRVERAEAREARRRDAAMRRAVRAFMSGR